MFARVRHNGHLGGTSRARNAIPCMSSATLGGNISKFINGRNDMEGFRSYVAVTGDNDINDTFFRRCRFITDSRIARLGHGKLSGCTCLFVIPVVGHLSRGCDFGERVGSRHVGQRGVLLPVGSGNRVSFSFVSSFVRRMRTSVLGAALGIFGGHLGTGRGGVKKNGVRDILP